MMKYALQRALVWPKEDGTYDGMWHLGSILSKVQGMSLHKEHRCLAGDECPLHREITALAAYIPDFRRMYQEGGWHSVPGDGRRGCEPTDSSYGSSGSDESSGADESSGSGESPDSGSDEDSER
jgi:hypothetical protein